MRTVITDTERAIQYGTTCGRMQERVQIDGQVRVVYSCKRILQGEHVGDYEIIVRRA